MERKRERKKNRKKIISKYSTIFTIKFEIGNLRSAEIGNLLYLREDLKSVLLVLRAIL